MWIVVHYAYEGDGITALYMPDGTLFRAGDYYHDKMCTWVEGFFAGMKEATCEEPPREDRYVGDEFDPVYDAVPSTLSEAAAKYTLLTEDEA